MKRLSFAIKTSLLAFILACGSPPPGQGTGEVETSSQANVGFKVEKVETFKKDLEVVSSIDPANLAPRAASNIPEHKVVLGLMQSCRYGQYQVADPEGNYVDVSEQ